MLPKHKQGAPALEKVQTFLLFHPQMMVVMMTKVLGWRSCGVIVVLVWCATHKGIRTGADFGTMAGSLTSTVAHPCLHSCTLFTPYTPFDIKGMYTLSPPVDSNAPPPSHHTCAQTGSPIL